MAFENKTNAGRVEKAREFVALVLKSAEANSTTKRDVALMLGPLLKDLEPYLSSERPEPVVEEKKGRVGVTAPQWASVRDMAQEASLKDLTSALAVYLSRIDDHLK